MIKTTLLPADTFIVINKTILNDYDNKVLRLLYQPIIGYEAVSLFLTFQSYLDKENIMSLELTHHHLVNNLKMSLDELLTSREKLEAIGLLKTYLKKGSVNNYIYELYSPIEAKEFLNNPILGIALYNNIGKIEFDKVVSYFKQPKISLKDYEDITVMFDDVFESHPINGVYIDDLKTTNHNNLKFVSKIDLNNILSLIPEDLINIRGITKEVKDLIYKLSFIYDLDDDMMQDIIRQSLNEKKLIDKQTLKKLARNYYQFENSGKLPSLLFRNQPLYLRKPVGDTSIKAKAIYQFETITPYDFLKAKNNGNRPVKSDLMILEHLLVDLNMNPGVVNVLIDYVLRINNNKLTKSFVEVIASQWVRSKIETVSDAMDIAEKEYHKKRKNVKVEKPSWFDKDIGGEEMSLEEQKELEEMFREFK